MRLPETADAPIWNSATDALDLMPVSDGSSWPRLLREVNQDGAGFENAIGFHRAVMVDDRRHPVFGMIFRKSGLN